MRILMTITMVLALCSCVSYYDDYEQSYATSTYTGYSYYNSPLRLRGLSVNDIYMLDNHPGDYLDTQMWGAVGHIGHFAVHSILQTLAH